MKKNLGSQMTASPMRDRIKQLYPRVDVELIFHVYRKNDCCISVSWNELDRMAILNELIHMISRIPNSGYCIDFEEFVREIEMSDRHRRPKDMILILRPLTDAEMGLAAWELSGVKDGNS